MVLILFIILSEFLLNPSKKLPKYFHRDLRSLDHT